jgi:hypothetical protein
MSSAAIDAALALALAFAAVAALSTAILEIWSRAAAARASRWMKSAAEALESEDFARLVARGLLGHGDTAAAERSLIDVILRRDTRVSGVSAQVFVARALDQLDRAGFFAGAPAAKWLADLRGNRAALGAELQRRFEAAARDAGDGFRRRTFFAGFALCAATAWTFNVDAFAVAERAFDASRKGQVVVVSAADLDAVRASAEKDAIGESQVSELGGLLERLRGGECRKAAWDEEWTQAARWLGFETPPMCPPFNVTALLGWLLTGLMATPGAKFWYDIAAALTRYRAAAR